MRPRLKCHSHVKHNIMFYFVVSLFLFCCFVDVNEQCTLVVVSLELIVPFFLLCVLRVVIKPRMELVEKHN